MIEAIRARLANAQSVQGPKYQTLRAAIVGAISIGEWTPGERLPTEAELAKTLPYSLGTIQKAYGELVKNGLVVRARGRGSFVAPIHRQMAEPWHCRFLADDGTILPIYPRLLGHQTGVKDPRLTQLFGQHAKITRIDRAISINDEFEVINRFFSTHAIAKSLIRLPRDKAETTNFRVFMVRELGMAVCRTRQTIRIVDRHMWRRLGIRSRPHLVLEATAYTVDSDVAYFQENYIPPNTRKLLFESELRY
jgi:GntR family transcriptional regulator